MHSLRCLTSLWSHTLCLYHAQCHTQIMNFSSLIPTPNCLKLPQRAGRRTLRRGSWTFPLSFFCVSNSLLMMSISFSKYEIKKPTVGYSLCPVLSNVFVCFHGYQACYDQTSVLPTAQEGYIGREDGLWHRKHHAVGLTGSSSWIWRLPAWGTTRYFQHFNVFK